eukprot:3546209-Prymnesium_polylepis.1
MLRGCFVGASWVLRGCFVGASWVLRGCFVGASWVLRGGASHRLERGHELGRLLDAILQDAVGEDALPLDVVRDADHRRLDTRLM